MIDRVGKQLGNYRLLRLLGRGGFAQVYLGEHIYLKSQAAIKVLHTQLASEDMQSFLGEARTLVHLVHPHIVRVLEFGIENETPFLVMDYAPSGTLRQRHPKGSRVPLPLIVEYVWQAADALEYAHTQKLVHRDIKPENMLLGRQNEILLTDFGIATIAQSSRYQGAQDMAGTISYMAPEQVQAHARPASDQYALGVVVYEWLCGERPFYGSFTEVAAKHAFVPPPSLREREPAIPPEVEQVVMIALQKDPKKRFGSIKAFAVALEQACHPIATRPGSFYSTGTMPNVPPALGMITPAQFPQPSAYAPPAPSYSVITPSTHTPPLSSSLSSPGFLPPPSTRVLSTESCTQWDESASSLRAKRLVVACLFVACAIMAGLVLSALFPLMAGHTHMSPVHNTPTPGLHSRINPTAARTPISTAPPRAAPPSVPAAAPPTQPPGPTPTSAPTQTPYPAVGGFYSGSIHNTPANVTSNMTLSINQSQGQVSGQFTVGPSLIGNGPFTGTVSSTNGIEFLVHTIGIAPLLFQGSVQPGGHLSGTYCSVNQNNQCDAHAGGYGTWNSSK